MLKKNRFRVGFYKYFVDIAQNNHKIKYEMKVKNHKLEGENVEYVKATSFGGQIVPDSIIIHYTAGPSGKATVKLFSSKRSKLSAHIVVHENGKVTQMVDFDRKAYHAGKSYYQGRSSFNNFSIGIEISNPGYLIRNPKGKGYVTWWEARKNTPKPVASDLIFTGKHRNYPHPRMTKWYKYTDEQIAAVFEICKALMEEYDIKYILGHEEIAPGRKSDPGPAFPLDEMREELFASQDKSLAGLLKRAAAKANKPKTGRVKVKLNFRAKPEKDADKLTNPIPAGTNVVILKEEQDWLNIIYSIKGWVWREDVEHDNTDEDGDLTVLAENIILREKPDKSAKKIKAPIKKGDKLYLENQKDHWLEVRLNINGWVAKKYVKF